MSIHAKAPPPDLAHWLTKDEAAAELGTSVKTVERMASRKEIERALRPTAHGKQQAVYNPDDIARHRARLFVGAGNVARAPFLLPAEAPLPSDDAPARSREAPYPLAPPSPNAIAEWRDVLLTLAAPRPEPPPPPPPPLFVTRKEAARILGVTEGTVRRLWKAGKLQTLKSGNQQLVRRACLADLTGDVAGDVAPE